MQNSFQKMLIVDDDADLRRQLHWAFEGMDVIEASDRKSAVSVVGTHHPAVVVLDLGLPPNPDGPTEGLSALRELLQTSPDTKVIVMTGQTQREYAVEAVALGAYDFYQKPVEIEVLSLIVQRAFAMHGLEQENRRLSNGAGDTPLPGLISKSAEMLKVCNEVRNFAGADVTLLLLGESGTGKEILARAIHQLSERSEGPFIAINCAAIPEHLLESEMFGHEKGAFTGALKTTVGRVEMAHKGTLLLDEIGDLPTRLQAKLLRFLQERVIERVGGRKQIPVDIRIISATNRDVQKLMAEGDLREDLYYRLSETVISIPPLRKRPEDTVVVAQSFLEKTAKQQGRNIQGFSSDALSALTRYSWPGNVRELENIIKRAVVTARGKRLSVEDLSLPSRKPCSERLTLREARERAERIVVTSSMESAGGNISKAARLLDTSRPTLYQLLEKYKLEH